jgi:hypothetical protein
MSDDKTDDENNEDIVKHDTIKSELDQNAEILIRDALKNFVKEKFRNRKTDDEIQAMVSTCSEFMKCFVIMGYDFEGNAIKPIFYARSDQDSDALNQYLQKFIINSLH